MTERVGGRHGRRLEALLAALTVAALTPGRLDAGPAERREFPKGRRALMETTVWGSYSVDAITNVIFGFGWFSEAHSTSPTVGAEIRLGRFRVRPNWRLKDGGFDARVTTIF